jgi:rod shape-determining protein MreD
LKPAIRIAVILVSVAVLQRGVFSQLRVADVSADLFLLVAVAAGMTGGPDRGAAVGFFSGLTLDLMLQTPLGLSALVYCLIGFVAGRLQITVLRANRLLPVLLAAVLSVAGVALYAGVSEVLGQTGAISTRLPVIMLVVAVANALLYPLARRLLVWAWDDEPNLRPALR